MLAFSSHVFKINTFHDEVNLKLFGFPHSPHSRRTVAVAKHLGMTNVEIKMLNLPGGEHTQALKDLNPNLVVPVLQDGSFTLWESNAIMQYLCAKSGFNTLWPNDFTKQADISRWLFWQTSSFGPACGTLVMENFAKDALFKMGPPNALEVEKATTAFHKKAKVLDTHLASNKFVCGNDLTIADFALASWLPYAEPGKIPMANYSKITGWMGRVADSKGWMESDPSKF